MVLTQNNGVYRLEGYDTFDGEFYPLEGSFTTEAEATTAARTRLTDLEKTQPASQSGGQDFYGIQDRVFVVCPDGRKYRVTTQSEGLKFNEADKSSNGVV